MNTTESSVPSILTTPELPEDDAPTAVRIVEAAELLRGSRLVLIEHRGALYRLSLTRNDRLVLQK
jgi:hemin uptake protein HemP